MAFTAKDVQALREKTGCGMMDCKNALKETDGNMDAAVDYLREKGLAVAAKRVDKESKQGIIALAEAADKKTMALAEVNCETDFVAKTEAFIKFVDDAAKVALEGNDIEAIKADTEALEKAFYALSEKLYAQQGGAQGQYDPNMGGNQGGAQDGQFYDASYEDNSNK